MFTDKVQKDTSAKKGPRKIVTEAANILESLITTFAMALMLLVFVVQPFVIPTGSMADTLKGAHFRLCCARCGYKYDRGFDSREYRAYRNSVPRSNANVPAARCPSCGNEQAFAAAMPVSNGDRILVLKCIYQFFEPKRWDVIVFKNPLGPSENYIKRLVGLPAETVEIIGGDIYINGSIVRKPPNVQEELWMPVYDNDYQPAPALQHLGRGRIWQQPFKNIKGSEWRADKDNPTVFCLNSPLERIDSLFYDTATANDFRAAYSYNSAAGYDNSPYCSDLMVRFYARWAGRQGVVGVELSSYANRYRAWVEPTGEMVIAEFSQGSERILVRRPVELPAADETVPVKFANVDHRLIFQFGSTHLSYDLTPSPESQGQKTENAQPRLKIFGSGELTLSHVGIFRDVYYTGTDGPGPGIAIGGSEFTLAEDEFFVLGDNSPASKDSRWWDREGIGNSGRSFRRGIVPREYILGKALFVFWPGGFKFPWPSSVESFLLRNSQRSWPAQIVYAVVSLEWIPNVGRMRLIYGGSGEEP